MRNHKGFTLIESLVVITIIAILLVVAVPNFALLQANNRIIGTANDLASALKQGRSEALYQRRNLQLSAVNSSASTNVWGSKGWRVTNPVLSQTFAEQLNIPTTITVNSTPAVNAIVFLAATGMITKTDATLLDIVFTVCDSSTKKEKGMDVSMSRFGRIVVVRHTTAATCNP